MKWKFSAFLTFLVILVFCSCSKEKSKRWKIRVQVFGNASIIPFNTAYFSKDRPYEGVYNTGNICYQEDHVLGDTGASYPIKSIGFEIMDTSGITSFEFFDEQIFSNLHACAYYWSGSKREHGYYWIKKGYIKGVKKPLGWEVDFDVYFGGKKGDKFRMKKDARYR